MSETSYHQAGDRVRAMILPWPPSANNYLRHTARGTYRTPKANAYRDLLALSLCGAGERPLAGPLRVQLDCYPPDRRRRDIDNLAKVLFDALTGWVWTDDSQVKELRVRLHDQVDQEGGSVWCVVSAAPDRTTVPKG